MEQTLPHYAERLADAGYTALTFDPTGFGESDGTPRGRYDPHRVIDDYAAAVNQLISRPDVDPNRVGIVGVCMGGGYAVSLGARDRRLKAVVSIAGGYDIGGTFQQAFGVDGFADYVKSINSLVQQQYESGETAYIPTIATALSEDVPIAAMPNEEAYEYYDRTSRTEAPNWPRELTADSLPSYFAYNSVAAAPLVAPTPLLVVHATVDDAVDYTSLNGGDPATMPAAELVGGWRQQLEPLAATQHLMGNLSVTVQEDSATCAANVTATHVRPNPTAGPHWTVGGRYDIGLRRAAGSEDWRIAALTLTVRWTSGNRAIMG